VTLASSATTSRALVTSSGLTSDGADHVGRDAGLVGEPAAVEVLEADQRVDVEVAHRLGVGLGDRLDVHPAHLREHRHRLLGRAVEDECGVVLLVDLACALDVELVDDMALDVHAEDRAGVRLRLGPDAGDLDAAGLAAPADLDLRLDDDWVAELLRGGDGLVDGSRRLALRNGDAVLGEELLALVLEEVHRRRGTVHEPCPRVLPGVGARRLGVPAT
jgi:hypothetical protein